MNKFDVTSVQNIPLRVGLKLDEFDVDEKTENRPFRELVGGLMWLAISTRPDISNAVRSVARSCSGKGMPCFPIFEDNQGAVQLSQNPVSNSNSKHIDVRHHF